MVDWIRPPRQTRSRKTLEALLDAAEALLMARPFEEVRVSEIADAAHTSVGAFYGRFASKQDLLRALYMRYVGDSEATMAQWLAPAAWEGRPLRDPIVALCAFVVRDYRARKGLRRAWSASTDPVLRGEAAALSEKTTAAIAVLISARPEISRPDKALCADLVHRIVFGVMDQDLHLSEAKMPEEVLARELANAVCGVLQAE